MDKGNIVKIKATVKSIPAYTPEGTVKKIRRYVYELPFTGIVLGYSSLKTGKIVERNHYGEPNYLDVKENHSVIVVEPLEQYPPYNPNGPKLHKTNRYLEPVRCFEDDLEVIK